MEPDATGPRIVIAGCGFGGIAMAVALKKAGIESFVIVERGSDVGGVWRDNSYPGAACDVPSRLYSFSFASDFPWSHSFAPQCEIHAYLRQCIDRFGLAPHLRLNTEIAGAAFDDDELRWKLQTADGDTIDAEIFVSAVGLFNRPYLPELPGRDAFAGRQFHSARWDHDFPLAGKNVAVIGTGASAIQFVPEIAREVRQLHVFQRTPQYVFPKGDRGGAVDETSWFRRQRLSRRLQRLKLFLSFERGTRRRSSDRMTRAGERRFLDHLERKVSDPELRGKLTPDYRLGCKRVLRSDDWYDALIRPNVTLVDSPIARILPEGVETLDERVHPADAIIYGTGFTPTDYLAPMRVTGRGGAELSAAWRDGAEAYFGITVAGFPNFFMLYGPNTNLSGSIIYMLESQARYVVRCIRTLDRQHARVMDVRDSAQRRINREIQRRIAATVLVDDNCHSYFRTASGRVTTQWPGFELEYRLRTRRVRTADYDFGDRLPGRAAPISPSQDHDSFDSDLRLQG